MNRWSLAVVIGFVAVLFAGAVAFSGRAPTEVAAKASVVELQVGNLTCSACVGRIEQALNKVDGIGEVSVDLADGTAQVGYDAARVAPETIAATISEAGYPATLASAQAPPPNQAKTASGACPGCKPVVKKGCGGGCCG
ncbi:MAG: heavy metal-associated domain-containing protein [Trichloromonas sp.]|jgi:copper chaperone CopZ|nr:heavy metal-associated domain-containing protein [Trichloromonas sp.]